MHRKWTRTEAWVRIATLLALFTLSLPAGSQDGVFDTIAEKIHSTVKSDASASDDPTAESPAPAAGKDAEAPPADAAAAADAATPDIQRISIVLSQSKSVTLPDYAKKVVIENPEMISVVINKKNPAELVISAKDLGVCEVTVTDRAGNTHRIEVTVTQDVSPLQKTLSRLYPDANIQVIPATDTSVVISGQLENPHAVEPIMQIARQFYPEAINALTVVGPQQVQLRVMVAEVSRSKLRAMGFNFLVGDIDGSTVRYFSSSVGGLITNTISSTDPFGLGFEFGPETNIIFGKVTNDRVFRGFLRALKEEGIAQIIAEPTLSAYSGRAATSVVGGEFPIIVPGQQGTFSVEWREYGVKLDFVPIVLGGGRIRLEVRPEVSELDPSNGVILAGFNIPALKQRRFDTSVEMRTSETFVLGGLLNTTTTATSSKVPYLGDLPLVGALFRTVQYDREEKELVVMVTPEFVEPLRPDQKPCAFPGSESTHPSNGDLFLNGRLETPACNECEMNRRAELGLDLRHTAGKTHAPCCGAPPAQTVTEAPKQAPTASELPAPVTAPAAAQRVTKLPQLLGPQGYEAGR